MLLTIGVFHMLKTTEIGIGKVALRDFPGPITLRSSRKKWWKLTIGAVFFAEYF
jgi:hypothetical protein